MCDDKSFHIGEQIRHYRTQKNMSQESLALAAGVNPAFVGQLERGLKKSDSKHFTEDCRSAGFQPDGAVYTAFWGNFRGTTVGYGTDFVYAT